MGQKMPKKSSKKIMSESADFDKLVPALLKVPKENIGKPEPKKKTAKNRKS
ncbi:MAG: hypothetical protein ABIK83_01120 [Candidatus Zixiibacteriota bacterium]